MEATDRGSQGDLSPFSRHGTRGDGCTVAVARTRSGMTAETQVECVSRSSRLHRTGWSYSAQVGSYIPGSGTDELVRDSTSAFVSCFQRAWSFRTPGRGRGPRRYGHRRTRYRDHVAVVYHARVAATR